MYYLNKTQNQLLSQKSQSNCYIFPRLNVVLLVIRVPNPHITNVKRYFKIKNSFISLSLITFSSIYLIVFVSILLLCFWSLSIYCQNTLARYYMCVCVCLFDTQANGSPLNSKNILLTITSDLQCTPPCSLYSLLHSSRDSIRKNPQN